MNFRETPGKIGRVGMSVEGKTSVEILSEKETSKTKSRQGSNDFYYALSYQRCGRLLLCHVILKMRYSLYVNKGFVCISVPIQNIEFRQLFIFSWF